MAFEPCITHENKGPNRHERLEPITASSHGAGAHFNARNEKGQIVRVYLPDSVLTAMMDARNKVLESDTQCYACVDLRPE